MRITEKSIIMMGIVYLVMMWVVGYAEQSQSASQLNIEYPSFREMSLGFVGETCRVNISGQEVLAMPPDELRNLAAMITIFSAGTYTLEGDEIVIVGKKLLPRYFATCSQQ